MKEKTGKCRPVKRKRFRIDPGYALEKKESHRQNGFHLKDAMGRKRKRFSWIAYERICKIKLESIVESTFILFSKTLAIFLPDGHLSLSSVSTVRMDHKE